MFSYYILDKKAALAPTTAATSAAIAANKLGAKCYSSGKFQDAIQHFSSAISLDGTKHIYYYNRSDSYRQNKSFASAIADARKVSLTRQKIRTLANKSIYSTPENYLR